jgi:predicted ArsR family transcriptional regulator
VPDQLDALGSAVLRAALLMIRRARGPLTVDEAAATMGVHRNVARNRLERLVAAGLVQTRFHRRSGRSGPGAGRPAKLYSAAPQSHALEFPAHHLPELLAELIDELPEEERETALRLAGRRFGHLLASRTGLKVSDDVAGGVDAVCSAMRELGFHAVLRSADDEGAVITTPTCPLRPLVAQRAEAANIDRGMWIGLVEHAVRDLSAAEVSCETDSCLDGGDECTVVLRFRSQVASLPAQDTPAGS